jgi:TRAP-type C4-dicarboxylate transport system permease small subunit
LLTTTINSLLVVLFGIMLSLSVAQIALRSFFGTAIPWADVASRNLVLWVCLFGAVLATRQSKHFQLDVLTRFLGQRTRLYFSVVAETFGAVVCLFLVLASVRFIAIGLKGSGEALLGLSVAVVVVIIPLSFGLMAVQYVLRGVDICRAAHNAALPKRQKARQQ